MVMITCLCILSLPWLHYHNYNFSSILPNRKLRDKIICTQDQLAFYSVYIAANLVISTEPTFDASLFLLANSPSTAQLSHLLSASQSYNQDFGWAMVLFGGLDEKRCSFSPLVIDPCRFLHAQKLCAVSSYVVFLTMAIYLTKLAGIIFRVNLERRHYLTILYSHDSYLFHNLLVMEKSKTTYKRLFHKCINTLRQKLLLDFM